MLKKMIHEGFDPYLKSGWKVYPYLKRGLERFFFMPQKRFKEVLTGAKKSMAC